MDCQRTDSIPRRTALRGLGGLVAGSFLAACGGRSAPMTVTGDASSNGIAVAATTTQLQDFVRTIGRDRVRVTGILTPNVDPHDYEPTARDAQAIAQARIVFVHGIGLDTWMEKTVRNARASAPVITTTDGIAVTGKTGDAPEGDPHVWFDPTLAQTMVTNIVASLVDVDRANADVYARNAQAYHGQLAQLDARLRGIFGQIPPAQRKLVTDHDAFRYLARRYGLTIVGTVLPGLSDTAEPSAKGINDLIETIKRERVKAIFAESAANPTVARAVAEETDVTVVDTLYGDSLGPPGSPGDTYLKMMVSDADTIANALT